MPTILPVESERESGLWPSVFDSPPRGNRHRYRPYIHCTNFFTRFLGIEFFGKSRDSNVSHEFANTTDDRLLLVNQIALMNDTNGMN